MSSTDFGGKITTYQYDTKDRLIRKTAGTLVTALTYTAKGMLHTVTTAEGTTTYSYNTLNQLTSEKKPDGRVIGYTYDNLGRLTKLTTPYGATSYGYDILSRLVSVTDKDNGVTAYTYDANGNLLTVTYPNGLKTTYIYNNVNALTGEQIRNASNAIVHEYVYTVGNAGERTRVVETGGRTVTYTYDSLYRLTKEVITQSGTTSTTVYAYDAVSNRTSKTQNGVATSYTYNALNQMLTGDGASYTYDNAGNRISKTDILASTAYTYDSMNRLTRVTMQAGQNVNVEEYTYDWQGNRTSKETELEEIHYLVDTNNWIAHVLAETDQNNTLLAYYTRGNDSLITQERFGTKSYYLYDGHGSVRMLASSAGAITDTYDYDAYGVMLTSTGTTENSYLYAGEQFDAGTELYYLRARYMEPSTGVFITMDTYQGNIHDPVSLHKYMYANANPVQFTDPTGYIAIWDTPVGLVFY